MGNFIGSGTSMAENFQKKQEVTTEMSKIKTERHIQMQNQIREREVALKIAHDRELSLWSGAFYSVFVPSLCIGWKRSGRYLYLAPIIPLTFILAYQIDQGYGNKVQRVRQEAEMIIQYEPELLDMPCGLPTASSIDQARLQEEEQKRIHPAVPAL